MVDGRTNIETAAFAHGVSSRDGEPPYQFLDLSGDHLGVRIEVVAPGGTTSHPHYHTAEEEHVIVLSGTGTLFLDDEAISLKTGDHVWFRAGETVPHHIENTSDAEIRLLVFGERKEDDVVFYPEAELMLLKTASGPRLIAYHDEPS